MELAAHFKVAEVSLRAAAAWQDPDNSGPMSVQTGEQTQTPLKPAVSIFSSPDQEIACIVPFLKHASKVLGCGRFLLQYVAKEGAKLIAIEDMAGCSDEALYERTVTSLAQSPLLDSYENYLLSRNSRLCAAGIEMRQPVLRVFACEVPDIHYSDTGLYMHLVLASSEHGVANTRVLTNFVRWMGDLPAVSAGRNRHIAEQAVFIRVQ